MIREVSEPTSETEISGLARLVPPHAQSLNSRAWASGRDFTAYIPTLGGVEAAQVRPVYGQGETGGVAEPDGTIHGPGAWFFSMDHALDAAVELIEHHLRMGHEVDLTLLEAIDERRRSTRDQRVANAVAQVEAHYPPDTQDLARANVGCDLLAVALMEARGLKVSQWRELPLDTLEALARLNRAQGMNSVAVKPAGGNGA